MRRLRMLLGGIIMLVVCLGGGVSAADPPMGNRVTVFDKDGTRVEVPVPVEKVVSVNSGMTTLVCALGAGDRLIGRDTFSTFPSFARDKVEVVAESSANCNLELIISKTPDLLLGDTMFYPQNREKLDAAGIPSYVDATSDPERLLPMIRSLGLLLSADERANQIVDFITRYTSMVDQRIAQLELHDGHKPKVFFEWHSPLETANAETTFHKPISEAGGLNIAAGQPVRTPTLSSEWVIQQNPDVIVNRISGDATLAQMKKQYEGIVQRPGWSNINAVKNHRVYVVKSDVFLTYRYPVGLVYYAKWFHPELFEDVDPEAVHREAVEKFLGAEEWRQLEQHEQFVYPMEQ